MEARLMENFREGATLQRFGPQNLPPNYRQLPYAEQRPIMERNSYLLKILSAEFTRLRQSYKDLTGKVGNAKTMKIAIRNTSASDILFYKKCFDNDEFHWNLYGNDCVNLEKYLSVEDKHYKFIISKVGEYGVEDIAFCHFYYNWQTNDYGSLGGIIPKYFNTGIGLYVSVAMFAYMFKYDANLIFRTGVFKYNQRALKAWSSIGFKPTEETDSKIIMKLTFAQFENQFVKYVLGRITLL
ncbi:MAG: hypothetical protein LBM61_03465 [Prevotellaceae bacterium]|jgi:hypothetical protein|nr:hypothetical protein [Prevotellaceae bacterium]